MSASPLPDATPERRAVIDVGTNSVKVLVGDVQPSGIIPVWETSDQTRLGSGLYGTQSLQPEAIRRTAASVARLAREARQRGAAHIAVLATNAAREARNSAELLEAISSLSGLMPAIISGEQEALWAYQGIATDPALD